MAAALRMSRVFSEDAVAVLTGADPTARYGKDLLSLARGNSTGTTPDGVPVYYVTATVRDAPPAPSAVAPPAVPPRPTSSASAAASKDKPTGVTGTGTANKASAGDARSASAPAAQRTRTVTFAVGVRDGIVRQIVTRATLPGGKRLITTETFTNVRVNEKLPDSLFTFTPPPGAVEVPAPPGLLASLMRDPREAAARAAAPSAAGPGTTANAAAVAAAAPAGGAGASPTPGLLRSDLSRLPARPRPGYLPVFTPPGTTAPNAPGGGNGAAPKPRPDFPKFSRLPRRSAANGATPAAAPATPAPAAGAAPAATPEARPATASMGTSAVASPRANAAAPSSPLEVAPGSGVTVEGPNRERARHDFGAKSLLDGPGAEQVFTLRNAGTAPVTLARLHASCGCLSAVVQPDRANAGTASDKASGTPAPAARLPLTLAPGESAAVRVAVRFAGLRPGPLRKLVYVYAAQGQGGDPNRPAAQLEMTGTLAPAVAFSVPAIDLGAVRLPGTTAAAAAPTGAPEAAGAVTVTATPDPRLLAASGAALPPLVSSSPDVTVTPLDGEGAAKPGTAARKEWRYRVSVAPGADLGPLSATLAFAPPPPPATPRPAAGKGSAAAASLTADAERAARADLAWRSATLPVFGEAVGPVRAAPRVVAFNVVPAGKESVARITLVADAPGLLSGITAVADAASAPAIRTAGSTAPGKPAAPLLSARVLPPPAGKDAAREAVLEVTLSKAAPTGALVSRVLLTLPGGRRLAVPVSAYVSAEPLPVPVPAVGTAAPAK